MPKEEKLLPNGESREHPGGVNVTNAKIMVANSKKLNKMMSKLRFLTSWATIMHQRKNFVLKFELTPVFLFLGVFCIIYH